MSNTIAASEYGRLLLAERPLIDVRAPIEFNKGAFPKSVNFPLMNDRERQLVGTCYKQDGQQAAITLGHQLVSGNVKQSRIDAWCEQLNQHNDSYLYCFRGGLRSQLSQQWLKHAGIDVPYIYGGYKALRSFLIKTIDQAELNHHLLILSGSTGSGKTEFIRQRKETINLEGLANHRGSSFGKQITSQPSQINFENNLGVALLKYQQIKSSSMLLLEDESFLIGRTAIPQSFFKLMQQAPIVLLEETFNARVDRLHAEYVTNMHRQYCTLFGEVEGFNAFSLYLVDSINKIRKRLGGKQHDELQGLIQQALKQQQSHYNLDGHFAWISQLLSKYYDPMYQYQLDKKLAKVIFKGNATEIHQWLDEQE
ncbi:tRNA 2-selenouridine(34) synthase MnmH [Shewanella sp. OMA3-2]|uniref:tRNA 2-selenouridine(34) synthase MnmH n=1 Tax=Shewanella sp. OMA3-2 TaxID=2908650 RepID=UPI001F1A69DE|nr:tRNA 2-selenouridine(34) synthase MnmH [Shewanella sp. OMA3-2]UJF22155.1 tRNA 2-selenouridine(34) synthase MnmH [Shewanella sp. OMA3-2]